MNTNVNFHTHFFLQVIASQDDSVSPIERMNMLKKTMEGFCTEEKGSEKEQGLSDEPLYRAVLEMTNSYLQQQQQQQQQ